MSAAELNAGGEPVKNATYWKRQFNLLKAENEALKRQCAQYEELIASWDVDVIAGDQWIPVLERLPEDGQNVAFVVKSELHDYLHGRILGGRYTAGISGGFSVPGMSCLASHWMPLPDAPDA